MVYFIIYYVVFNIVNHLNIITRYILRFINIVNVACELFSLICKGICRCDVGQMQKNIIETTLSQTVISTEAVAQRCSVKRCS